MKKFNGFHDLIAWQKAMELAVKVQHLILLFPKHDQICLGSQMYKALVSIPSNIAEGYRRRTKKDFQYFLRIALGSAAELETQIIIAKKCKLAPMTAFTGPDDCIDHVQRLINKLHQSLNEA